MVNLVKVSTVVIMAIIILFSNLLNNEKEKRFFQDVNIIFLLVIIFSDLILSNFSYYHHILKKIVTVAIIAGSILLFYLFKLSNRIGNKNKSGHREYRGYYKKNGNVYLNSNSILLRKFFKLLTWILILVSSVYNLLVSDFIGLLVEVFKGKKLDLDYSFISYFCLMAIYILFINEIAAYLDGDLLEKFTSKLDKKDETEEVIEKEEKEFLPLYNDYKKIWNKNILADFRPKNIKNEEVKDTIKVDERIIESNKTLKEIYGRLKKEYKITSENLNILKILLDKEDIIIGNSNYEELAPVLFSYLENSIIKGKKVLILAENSLYNNFKSRNTLKEWVQLWFKKLYKKSIRKISEFNEWITKSEWDILIATQNELIKYQEEFIKKIQEEQEDVKDIIIIVINEKPEEVAENILTLSVLTNILNTYFRVDKKKGENGAQYIILSNETSNLNESINKNLGISAKNISLSYKRAENIYSILWRTDTKNEYYTDIMNGIPKNNMGISNVLSYLSWEHGYRKAEFINEEDLPYESYKMAVEGSKYLLKDRPIIKEKIEGVYEYFAKYNFISSIIKKEKYNLLYIYDKDQNFPLIYKKYSSLGEKEVFLNIITPVYLLRDYFIDNIEYFTNSPIYGYTPKIESDKFKVASYLKEVLINEKLDISEDDIKSELLTIKSKIGNIEEEIVKLFKEIYLIDILKNDYLTVINKQIYNLENKRFEEKKFFRINRAINENGYFKWFENFEITDTGKNVYELIPLEHIYQNYLPGQTHYFNGNSFKIEKIDILNKKINISPTENDKFTFYRNKEIINLSSINKNDEAVITQKGSASYNIIKKVIKIDWEINTIGYFEFSDNINMSNQKYQYINLEEENLYKREYKNSKMLTLTIELKDKKIENIDGIAVTLSIILNEIFKTLFSGNSKYLKLFPMVTTDFFEEKIEDFFKTGYQCPEILSQVLPSMVTVEKGDYEDILGKTSENRLSIYLLEDSHKDMGLLQAVQDNYEDILELIQDYLNWLEEDNSPEKGWNKVIFTTKEKKTYLKYGKNEELKYLYLNETKEFLNSVLGKNKYTDSRKRYYSIIINEETEDEFDKEYEYLKEKIRERENNEDDEQ